MGKKKQKRLVTGAFAVLKKLCIIGNAISTTVC